MTSKNYWYYTSIPCPGIWAYGGDCLYREPVLINVELHTAPSSTRKWYCYLGPVPVITPRKLKYTDD